MMKIDYSLLSKVEGTRQIASKSSFPHPHVLRIYKMVQFIGSLHENMRKQFSIKREIRTFYAVVVPYPTPLTIRGMGSSLRRNDFWDRLGVQALVMTTAHVIPKRSQKSMRPNLDPFSQEILKWGMTAKKRTSQTAKQSVFPLKIGLRAFSPQSRFPFSTSLQTFCLTVHAHLKTQKYGLFCSLCTNMMHVQSKVIGETIVFLFIAVMKRGET